MLVAKDGLTQMPRLSAYDPGASGEGGLDPLGLGALADRLANVLVPGLRARMSNPRFVTISAVGAIACQSLTDKTADQGKTSADIAFEWMVVEALVRDRQEGRTEGLPGSQKAARAKAANERLSRRNYLSGPRVFGFTGVYRPFSRDAGVFTQGDQLGKNACCLVQAWERDRKLNGYVDNIAGTPGHQLRMDIEKFCSQTLDKGESVAPETFLSSLAPHLAPREADLHERRMLREFVATGQHETRNELARKLIASPPSALMTQRDLAQCLLPNSSTRTRLALHAAIAYEDAATSLDYAFRRFLAYTQQQNGSMISAVVALGTPQLAELAPRIGDLAQRAIDAVSEVGDEGLASETLQALQSFVLTLSPAMFLDALIGRHEAVQAGKRKLSWLDQIDGEWTVRAPYRNQSLDLKDEIWTHPMRLQTLATFLAQTA